MKFNYKKILVTGGAGFMGSHFARKMVEEGRKVIVLDKLTYCGNLDNLSDLVKEKNFSFVKGDVCDAGIVKKVFDSGIDAVAHFAAETHVDRSIDSPRAFVETDVLGTFTLLEEARKRGTRFLHISTDEVYGSVKRGLFKESDAMLPNSPYSASKAGAEMLCRAYFITYGLPVSVIRSVNFYGTHQYPEKLIPRFITNLLLGKKVPVYGTGKNVRGWIFTEDYCNAAELVLEKGEPGEAYNVDSGDYFTNLQVTKMLLKLLWKDSSSIEFVEDRKGHDFRYALEARKIRKLGWKPRVKFEEGLSKTVEWYRKNQQWWGKLVAD
jgi:dTDP-glucose 4,6-dehydratase